MQNGIFEINLISTYFLSYF